MRPFLRLAACALLLLLLFGSTTNSFGQSSSQAAQSQFASYPIYQIVEHKLPAGSSQPWTITNDSNGNLWFTEQASNQIGEYIPATGVFHEYAIPTPKSLPQGIAVDPTGNVWFAEVQTNRLGELPLGSGSIVEYQLQRTQVGLPCGPIGVTPQSVGGVWVTCEFSNQIDQVRPTSPGVAVISTFDLPVPYSAPLQVLFDRTGNIWFTAADSGMLGYATVSELQNGTSNGIREFPPINSSYKITIQNPLLPSGMVTTSLAVPSQMALSPAGDSIWITEHGAGTFDRYEIASETLVKYWTSRPQNPNFTESLPNGIAVDSKGVVWMAEHYGNAIARFDPQTESLTEYKIPCCGSLSASTLYLTLGKQGSIWFTEFNGNAIGELVLAPGNTGPTLKLDSGSLTMASSDSKSLTVQTSLITSPLQGSTVHLFIAGISARGALENLSANFAPNPVTSSSGGNGSATLTLTTKGLQSGIYYLTVSAQVSGGNLTESRVLKLTVLGFEDQFRGALLDALYVGAAASVAIVVFLYLRSGRRGRKNRR